MASSGRKRLGVGPALQGREILCPDLLHRATGSGKSLEGIVLFSRLRRHPHPLLFQIVQTLAENGELEKHARELDMFYISGLYPDAFPGGAPFEIITEEQADRAMHAAIFITAMVKVKIEHAAQ